MTDKLKTLKDMVYGRVPKEIHNELRAEAIRDYKYLRDKKKNSSGGYYFAPLNGNLERDQVQVILFYIAWKFNLTEEDLK